MYIIRDANFNQRGIMAEPFETLEDAVERGPYCVNMSTSYPDEFPFSVVDWTSGLTVYQWGYPLAVRS